MKKILSAFIGVAMIFGVTLSANAVPTYNGHNYDLVYGGATGNWYTAEAAAVALGGHLVTINDASEQTWLISTFGTGRYWIGFTDSVVSNNWQWVSGEPVTYTNWAGGEPNNFGGENWAVMNWSGNNWNDLAPGNSPDGAAWGAYYGIAEWTPQSSVPEPASLILLGSGLIGVAAIRRRIFNR